MKRFLMAVVMVVMLSGCGPTPIEWIQSATPPVTVMAVDYGKIIFSDGNGQLMYFTSSTAWSDDIYAWCHTYNKGDVVKAGEPPAVIQLRQQLAAATNDLAVQKDHARAWETIAFRWADDYNNLRANPTVVTCYVDRVVPSPWVIPTNTFWFMSSNTIINCSNSLTNNL